MARPLVRYFLDENFFVTVASRTLERAKNMCPTGGHSSFRCFQLDMEHPEAVSVLEKLIPDADVVISMLPYVYHPKAAEVAIRLKTHFLTTSYVSDAMKKLECRAKEAGVILLNECGVDPGTDHMSAQRVIHNVQQRGGKVRSFSSICGGLPAPEHSNNPFGYKFSWAPRGVLLAARNSATFMDESKEVVLANAYDKVEVEHFDELDCDLEWYPNRNALPYLDIYGIRDEAHSIIRGTYRYSGWCSTIKALLKLGLFSLDEVNLSGLSYSRLMRQVLAAGEDCPIVEAAAAALGLPPTDEVIMRMKWLGMFSDDLIPEHITTYLDVIAHLMFSQEEMHFHSGERDIIVMRHRYLIEYENGTVERVSTTLIERGEPNGTSAMAKLVAAPIFIAAKMVLGGQLNGYSGLVLPIVPQIYNVILDELEHKYGIKFVDEYVTA